MPSNRPRYALLTIIVLSYLMLIVDASIVITALPSISRELGFSPTGLAWVTNAYSLAMGGLLLLGARAGDILGRRSMFIVGLAVFTGASLAIGLAPSAGWLVAGRVVQGVGGAVLGPSTLALLSAGFPDEPMRSKALAIYSSITGLGTSLGLVLGGVITDLLSWRWAFLINIPIGMALLLTTRRFIVETERHTGKFDLIGAVTSTFGMSALVYGLIRSAEDGWTDPATIGSLLIGIALLVTLVLHERTALQPIMPLRLFASRERSGAYLARLLFVGAMMGFWFFVSQFLQDVRGMNPMQTGIAFLPMTLASFVIAFVVPKLSRRYGDAPMLIGGLTTVMLGMFWLSRMDAASGYLLGIALPMVLVGFGQGAATIRLTTAGIAGVEPRDTGAASGLVSTAVGLGNAFGLSVLIAVSAHVAAPDAISLIVARTETALASGSALIAIALVVSVFWISRHPLARHEEESTEPSLVDLEPLD